jgi:hypothetical protein
MGLQDKTVVRTAADLEKKYNFPKMLGLAANVETNKEELVRINNELNNMLTSLIINLGDVLDSQTNVSLWFFSGKPGNDNEPYINWDAPSDHIGDLYYDRATGKVYKFTEPGWVEQTDSNLISALALTNAELDVSEDNERIVYFSQPIPPYSNGDWWILEDGTLKICQLSKDASESYETDDFVVSSKYTTTVATKQGDTITVLKGTVTQITEDYVKFTDLSTGGSTTIAGENIKTGTIDATKVKIANDNVLIDAEGIKLSNGAKVVGTNGLMNTYVYETEGILGYMRDWEYNSATGQYDKIVANDMFINFIIPEGLSITSATIQVVHTPIQWAGDEGQLLAVGRTSKIKLQRATNMYGRMLIATLNSEIWSQTNVTTYEEITTAFGSSGWTPPTTPTTSNHPTESKTSGDIKDFIRTGLNQLRITNEAINQKWTDANIAAKSGFVYAILKIDGYMTYS